MILFLTTLDKQLNQRDFSCSLTTIEAHLDFLNNLVAIGNTLLSAYITEGSTRLNLPLEAFDGAPISKYIQALEESWKGILHKPNHINLYKIGLIELAQRRVTDCNARITTHTQMIDTLTVWIRRMRSTPCSTIRSSLLTSYSRQINSQQASLNKAYYSADLATCRLGQLMS